MFQLRPAQTEDSNIMSLRDHLLAAQAAAVQPVVDLHQAPSHDTQIDPQIAASFSPSPVTPGMEPQNPEVRKGRRELSTSKRAAQNRAAQRAFRQRKEQYIQTLKSQVSNYEQMATNYKNLEKENLILREYIIQLQSRLLDAGHRDIPPAPAELTKPSLAASSAALLPSISASAADLSSVEAQLQEAAAAAAADEDSPDDTLSLGAQLQEAAAAAARQIGGSAGAGDEDKVD